MTSPIEAVLAELRDRGEVKPRGKGWRALCPVHGDTHPSLDIDEGEEHRVLLCCRSRGCSAAQIVGALGLELRDLFNGTYRPDKLSFDERTLATYDYCDERGELLYQAVRLWDEKRGKDFRQRRPDGKGGWTWRLDDARRVLYRLPELLASSGPVFVVEGEKDADNLARIGLTATTNPMGAGKWRAEYAETLRGREVAILPDNDGPGRAHAAAVAESLRGVAASVRVVALPGLAAKGDVSDWLAAGGTAAQLVELPAGEAPATIKKQKSRWPDPVPITELAGDDANLEWLCKGMIARRHITLFSALFKSGKTTALSHQLLALQRGEPFFGRPTKQCRTLLVSEESKALWCQRRDLLGLDASLSIMNRVMKGKPTLAEWCDFILHIRDKAEGHDLVVIDTADKHVPWRNENDAAEVNAALLPLNLLTDAGMGIEIVHHFGKNDQGEGKAARGSSALAGAVDILLEFRRYKPDDRIDRRRVLNGLGRFDCIPDEIVVALSDNGTRYVAEGDRREIASRELHTALLSVLPGEPPGNTCDDIHAALPEAGRPRRGDLMSALRDGATKGDWQTAGAGKPKDPRRFWRAEA